MQFVIESLGGQPSSEYDVAIDRRQRDIYRIEASTSLMSVESTETPCGHAS